MERPIFTVLLPDIGEGVAEGEVIEWLKNVGASLRQDEPVVVVMTDKATVELPAPYPGILAKQHHKPGEIVRKDTPLYDIGLDENVKAVTNKHTRQKNPCPKEKTVPNDAPQQQKIPSNAEPRTKESLAIPKVRHLAKELGINIDEISGSGKDGRVLADDLKNSFKKNEELQPVLRLDDDEVQPLIGIRGLMAKKMSQSKLHIPQFSYFEQVDVSRLIQMRQKFKDKALSEGIRLSYMPFFIRALSLIIKKYPIINSSIDITSNAVVYHKQQNIGIAIASPQGLIVPVLKGVQDMSLDTFIRSFDNLKVKAQGGHLTSKDMKDATITISNFGVLGDGLWATPMISDSQVAILAVARMRKAPIVKNEELIIRDVLPLSWSFDHRVIDGELAAQISQDYCRLLKDPVNLLS